MIYDWLQHIEFAWPENFLLLGLLPFIIYFYYRNKKAPALLSSHTAADIPRTFKTRLRHLPFFLRIAGMALLITALARPQVVNLDTLTKGDGIDIVLCMDVSGSMGARDIAPSRLQAAKEVAISFVKNRPVDRIGLVVFSGESFTKCPITPDKNTVIQQIESLSERDGGFLEPGTLIGEGLAMSVNRVAKGSSKTKVVILLTDGKEDAPMSRILEPETAIEIAKTHKVKVYSIGMGGGLETAGEQEAPDGGQVKNFIDEDLLRKIARETGGTYFRATDKATLQSIYAQIDILEKSKVDVISKRHTTEMFMPLVIAALLLLFIEIILRYTFFRAIS